MDTRIIAPYLLRSYVWQMLKVNTEMTESDYDGNIPIVPLAEEPELTQYSKPYIVYGFSENPVDDDYYKRRGAMAFIVYSENFRTLSDITNTIATALEKEDEAARRVNEFSSVYRSDGTLLVPTIDEQGNITYNPNNPDDRPYLGLRFGHVGVSFIDGGSPEDSEGGRQTSIVNIIYEYYVDYDIETKLVPSSWPS